MHIKIKKYSKNYKSRLIELLQFLWKNPDESERIKKFEWLYEKNPYQKEPFIYVALDDEKLVASRAFVPSNFTVDGSIIKIFCGADAIIHPDYRRRGIFSQLQSALIKDIRTLFPEKCIIIELSANQASTPGLLKLGLQQTNGIKKSGYKISLFNYLKVKLFKRKESEEQTICRANKKNMCLELSKKLYAYEISTFLKENRRNNKITNVRDETYFLWNYSYKPEKYVYVYCRKNSILIGYVIIKHISDYQSSIEEYFSLDPEVLQFMINVAAIKLTVPILRTRILTTEEKTVLQKCGFIGEFDLLMKLLKKKRLSILIRPVQLETIEKDFFINGIDIRDIDNWQLYLADKH